MILVIVNYLIKEKYYICNNMTFGAKAIKAKVT